MGFPKQSETFHDGDPGQITSASKHRATKRVSAIRQLMEEKIAEVAERNREAHIDPTVRVTHVEPWSLREKPKGYRPKRKRGGAA